MSLIPARVGLQQRVLPEYRAQFFDLLASACLRGLSVFSGKPRSEEAIEIAPRLSLANQASALNWHISKGRTYLCWQFGFLSWLAEWQPEVLIVEANPRYPSTSLAIHWMHNRGRPVIGWGLGSDRSGELVNSFRTQFLKNLDAVIAYSENGKKQYINAGIPADKVFVAANAASAKPALPAVERGMQFNNNTACLLYVGRLQPRKRIDCLLEACALLPDELKPRLVIVGDGPDRARLQQMAWQVYPKAVFEGAKYGKDLEKYYLEADLFILPGTGGLAVQQAMGYALPIISGEADGTQHELIRPGNGWILADRSAQTMAETIQNALVNLPRLRAMGMESYRIVAEEVNLEAMVITFGRAIRSVLH